MLVKKIRNFAAFSSLVLFGLSCSSLKHSRKMPTAMPGTWQAKPIVIDGDCTDWPSPYPNYDADALVAYATSNDGENLYITMQTGDPLTQIKILKQGMTVSIDTGGRKDAGFNVNYPMQNVDDLSELFTQNDHQKSDASPQLSKQFHQRLVKSADDCHQFSLDGFGTCSGAYLVSQTLPCGVLVKLSIDEYKQLVWEAMIPFKALYNTEKIDPSYAGKHISVCFAVKGFKSPSSKGNDNSAQQMNTGNMGGGGMGGAGMGGGGRMNSSPMGASGTGSRRESPLQRLYESSKTWKHFKIAWH